MDATALHELLADAFVTHDQRTFLDNYKIFLQYDQDRDFVVDFDQVYCWMGFTQKVHAKRLLVKHFDEGTDYTISNDNGSQGRVGRNRETIMLTPTAYKNFCMRARTPKADDVRHYYRKLETVMFKAAGALQTIQDELASVTAKAAALETAMQTAQQNVQRQKKAFPLGHTLYIVREYGTPDLFKVGSSCNMGTRSAAYYTHSVNAVAIVYTRRCMDCRLMERLVHRRLQPYVYNNRPDWFQAPFELIRRELEHMITYIEGDLSPEYTLDEAALTRCRPNDIGTNAAPLAESVASPAPAPAPAPVPPTPTIAPEPDLPPLLEPPPPDFARFIEECYDRDADGKAIWIEMTARYRLWSRNTQNQRDALAKYLDDAGYRQTYSYDRRTRVNAHAIAGLRMKPLPGFCVNEASTEVERFLHDRCATTVTARATILQLHGAFAEWKKQERLSLADKRALSEYCNLRFVPSTVHDGTRIRGGYYGLCLRGHEMVGLRTKPGLRKPVQQVDPSTQEVVREYDSITEASKALRVTIARLSVAISGSRICNGFLFRLAP